MSRLLQQPEDVPVGVPHAGPGTATGRRPSEEAAGPDPEEAVLADAVAGALAVVLDALTPAEPVAFVLLAVGAG